MLRAWPFVLLVACSSSSQPAATDAPPATGDAATADAPHPAPDGPPATCTQNCEQAASDRMDAALGDPVALAAFMAAMPKGGDLHNHLSGAVYAETYLGWAKTDGTCINSSSYAAVSSCSASTQPTPAPGVPFYDAIIDAWSMRNYTGTNGHDHFFATFGKYGIIAGGHRDETLGDIADRAAGEHELYIETMFNLGKNVGALPSGTITAANLQTVYDQVLANPSFTNALTNDVAVVDNAYAGYRAALQCDSAFAPPSCDVELRFVAQISRTGSNASVFGQLISAFEMAKRTNKIVAANLSSPEDDTASLNNYALHMAMLDFLHGKYAGTSPLHITLHAGELVPQYLPAGHTNDNTFHIHDAVITGHAERIGHGVDIASETDSAALLQTMRDQHVMVEVCLSSNAQILGVSGAAHPLATYLAAGVPVALATDDQGVSRSSLAGEMVRAATDQHLTYRQLKLLGRTSLEHAFLPGASLWSDLGAATMVADCATTEPTTDAPPAGACATFLAASEKATLQWKLEVRYHAFEAQQ